MSDLEKIEFELSEKCFWCQGKKKDILKRTWCASCGGSGLRRTRLAVTVYPYIPTTEPAPYLWYGGKHD